MIRIRTVTYNMPHAVTDAVLEQVAKAAVKWSSIKKYTPRTQRLNLSRYDRTADKELLFHVEKFAADNPIRWFNIPIDPWASDRFEPEIVKEVLSNYPHSFCNVACAKNGQINERIIEKTVDTFFTVATLSESGKDNFRFGATMNVRPNGPFFPFTFSSGERLSFAIGLELAAQMNEILMEQDSVTFSEARERLEELICPQIEEIIEIAKSIAADTGICFDGIDFSLAPLPDRDSSCITILERLGVHDLNAVGMLHVTALMTDMLKTWHQKYNGIGFSGVMYSLLEDYQYAAMNNRTPISVDKMIALSTMCGCGVDMVPISIDTSPDCVRSILLDVACISSRLSKPLGVRLLPLITDEYGFTKIHDDQDFIVNTKVVSFDANVILPVQDNYCYLRQTGEILCKSEEEV